MFRDSSLTALSILGLNHLEHAISPSVRDGPLQTTKALSHRLSRRVARISRGFLYTRNAALETEELPQVLTDHLGGKPTVHDHTTEARRQEHS